MSKRINYQIGNLFDNLPTDGSVAIIAHVCNDIGLFGSGFVIPLAKKWPVVRDVYVKWHRNEHWDDHGVNVIYGDSHRFMLGNVQIVAPEPNIYVANMIAQKGVISPQNFKPIKYTALGRAMELVVEAARRVAQGREVTIYAPLFGSDRAGGNWDFIEELVNEIWIGNNLPVTIFQLPENVKRLPKDN